MLKREEKIERLKWMLEAVESGALRLGLCNLYKNRYGSNLTKDIPEIVPGGEGSGAYWFYPGEAEPRIKFLHEWIDKLSGEKSLVQQLVDNVNQNGGEIFGLRVGDKLPEDTINAWQSAGENCYTDACGVHSTDGPFNRSRKIISFFVVGGEVFFRVSDTLDVYLRAEGYKKFAEEFETPEQTYSIGQRFLFYKGREEYILSCPRHNKAVLIHLGNGNRFSGAVNIEDSQDITEKEFKSISAGQKFTLIDKK